MRTARSTTAAAPTPAFLIDSRVPSLANAREPYHLPLRGVNTTRRGESRSGRRREGLGRRLGRRRQVGLRVGERDERRLELRGGQVHAPREHRLEEARVPRGIGLAGRGVVVHGTGAEERG